MQENKALTGIIRRQIEGSAAQAIPFRDYMELCLYHPVYGYYMKEKEKIGKSGDFYTSASIGGLFGEVLAHYTARQAEALNTNGPITLLEWGAGNGQLAQQLLDTMRLNRADIYDRLTYISIEASPYHRALQADRLAEHAGRIQWLTEQQWVTDGPRDNVIIYSNELLDAFPVHRVQMKGGQWNEIYVSWNERGGCFQEKLVPLKDPPLEEYIRNLRVELLEGQQLEVNIAAAAWVRRLGNVIRSGQLVTVDYGDCTEELYAPYRMNGTLMCYRNHIADDNPYADPGNQDITSHVNFSRLISEGAAAGLQKVQYVTQKQFLVENGLLHKLQNTASTDPFSPEARRNRAIRQLLLSDQMSELFKVLIQKKSELP